MPGSGRPVVRVVRQGLLGYSEALRYIRLHRGAAESEASDTLLLCQHPPVYTVGIRRAPYPGSEEVRLRSLGTDFHRMDHGGLLTFHGPGQLVCYPVLDLRRFRRSGGLRWYVSQLEAAAIGL